MLRKKLYTNAFFTVLSDFATAEQETSIFWVIKIKLKKQNNNFCSPWSDESNIISQLLLSLVAKN